MQLRLQLDGHRLRLHRLAHEHAQVLLEAVALPAVRALVEMRFCLGALGVREDAVHVRLHHFLAVCAGVGGRHSLASHRCLGHRLLQDTPTTVQARHDGADRDVENLRGVGVGEVADVDEHDDVAKVVRHLGQRSDDVVLRQPLDDAVLVARAAVAGRLELVVEEVVAFLERLHVGRALLPPAAVDVQVREDAQQPRAQVRAGLERAPTAEGARVRLLHQILGLLAGADEMAGDSIDLIRQCKRVLLEAHAVARFCCNFRASGSRVVSLIPGHPSKLSPS